MTHNVERVFADIDADHGDRCVEFLRHGVLLVLSAPCQLFVLEGPEHGRTIPLADSPTQERRTRDGHDRSLLREEISNGRARTARRRPKPRKTRSESRRRCFGFRGYANRTGLIPIWARVQFL